MKGVRNRMRLKFILNGSGKTLNGSRLMAFDDRSVSDGSFLTEEQGAFHRGTTRSSPRKKEPLILRVQK
ncbi:hypothetical protein [Bacteroides clarus]|uniref:hypothetical protein n=2 Tax=Bacteroides clarus TaxID=626929 RepID=UPI00189E4F87|nr:hypothetical protein [Bacteroides clarus]